MSIYPQQAEKIPLPDAGRMERLDVLRGLAILLVLFRHPVAPWYAAGPLSGVMHFLQRIGWTGVDLFFVLSGFLIGGLLFREIRQTGRLNVRRFLLRRGLKIWPPYFALLLVAFLIEGHRRGFGAAGRLIAPNLLHLQNYLGAVRGITWSLAVEEHFYLLLPAFLLLIFRSCEPARPLRAIPVAAILLVLACTALRACSHSGQPLDVYVHLAPTHLRIDGLFFGVMIAYLLHFHPDLLARLSGYRLALMAVGLGLVLPMGFFDLETTPWIRSFGITMLYVGYGCILVVVLHSPPGDGLGNLLASRPAALIAWVGLFSYSIYLWHFDLAHDPLIAWVAPRFSMRFPFLQWLGMTAAYLVLATLSGALLTRLIEAPFLKLRDRWYGRPESQGVSGCRRFASNLPASLGAKSCLPSEHGAFAQSTSVGFLA